MTPGSVDKSLDQATAYAAYLTTGWAATNFCAHTTTVLTEVNAEYEAMVAGAKTAFNNNGLYTARLIKHMTSYAASGAKTVQKHNQSRRHTNRRISIGLSTLAGLYPERKETF